MIPRYETQAMRDLFSDEARLERWTRIELLACRVRARRGDISPEDISVLNEKVHAPTMSRVLEIEETTQHDVVAFVRALGEVVGHPASRHLHHGLTSSDVVDTALAVALRDGLKLIVQRLDGATAATAELARRHKHAPCVGRTHGVHAEPMTLGLKFLGWYSELKRHRVRLLAAERDVAYGKLSGAVGTFSQTDPEFEALVLRELDLLPEPIATQVIPRDRHATVMNTLAVLAGGVERIATEIRHLQRTEVREVEEPFREGQTGSSAMPHKKNPITAERLCGLARLVRGLALASMENQALWHERDISHSSVERVSIAGAFHLVDYMLEKLTWLVGGLRVNEARAKDNLLATRGLVFSQSVLDALLKAGLDRTAAYGIVQRCSLRVWEDERLTLEAALKADSVFTGARIPADVLTRAFDATHLVRHADALFARAGLESP